MLLQLTSLRFYPIMQWAATTEVSHVGHFAEHDVVTFIAATCVHSFQNAVLKMCQFSLVPLGYSE